MKMGKLLLSIVIVSLIVSMAIPLAAAPKPDKPGGGGGKPQTPASPGIAYSGGNNFMRLYVMDMDGDHRTMIHNAGTTIHLSTWSPEGDQIAFVCRFAGELWVIDVDVVDGEAQGSNARLIKDGGDIHCPAWSPLGDEIAITTTSPPEGGETEIHLISAVDGSLNEILYSAPSGWSVGYPAWSPDGTKIAFVEHVTTYDPELRNYNIRIIDVNTKEVTTTAISGWWSLFESYIDWAHDHDWLVFHGSPIDRDTMGLYIYDIVSGDVTLIDSQGGCPSWSYDDTKIIHGLRTSGKFDIMSLDLATGESTRLARSAQWAEARPPSATWPA